MPTTCPRCDYVRKETDTCATTHCPSCNAAYAGDASAATPNGAQAAATRANTQKPSTTWMWFVAAALVAASAAQSDIFSSREPSSAKLAQPAQSVASPDAQQQAQPQLQASAPVLAPTPPQTNGQPAVTLYSAAWCGYCDAARRFFKKNNIAFTEYDIEKSAAGAAGYKKHGGGIPVIVIGDEKINGFEVGMMREKLGAWIGERG